MAAATMASAASPGARARADLAGEHDDRHDQQQRIGADIVDRQADGGDGQEPARPSLRQPVPAPAASSRVTVMEGPEPAPEYALA